MALVVLSKVEQRLDAVRAVLAGASVVEVAAAFGVSRVSRCRRCCWWVSTVMRISPVAVRRSPRWRT